MNRLPFGAVLGCLLLLLAGCGQTGPLVLPGSVPAPEPATTESSDEEDQESDDVRQ